MKRLLWTLVVTVVATGVFCGLGLADFSNPVANAAVQEDREIYPYPFDDPERLTYVSGEAWSLCVQCDGRSKVFCVDASDPCVRGVSTQTRLQASESIAYVERLGWDRSVAVGCVLNRTVQAIEEWLEREIERAPVDACVVAGSPIAFLPERDGVGVDRAELYDAIVRAVATGEPAVLRTHAVRASVTRSTLSREVTRLSSFTTSIAGGTADRRHNVRLAMRAFAFCPIAAGERVSFNAVVGARTEERGYRGAKVIVDGEYVDGVGGGVCQASTTIYNAVLLAGLRVDRAAQHSIAPAYVAPSRDAMVSEGISDLVWTNATGRTVWLVTKTTEESVTAAVYGYDDGTRYEIESVVCAVHKPPAPEVVEDDGSYTELFRGEEQSVTVRLPHDGVESEAYLVRIAPDGSRTRTRLRRDRYKPVRAKLVLRRGKEQEFPSREEEKMTETAKPLRKA